MNPTNPEQLWGDDEDPPLLMYVGGGLVIGGSVWSLPAQYSWAINHLLKQLFSADWQQWWEHSGQGRCLVYSWIGGDRTEVRVRRSPAHVYAACDRAIPTDDPDQVPDPGQEAALADATALVAKLRDRFALPEPPPWSR